MAKKPAKTKTRKTKAKAKMAPETASKVIGERALGDLFKLSAETKERSKNVGAAFKEAIQHAKTNQGLNSVAFGMVDRLRRIGLDDTVKLREVMDAFDYYRDVAKLDRKKAADMFKDAKPEKAAPPTSGPGTPTPESDLAKVGRGSGENTDNVTPIREKAVA
jgi:hypothetical protein